jgi:GNAT superfamily N-acetyltransferase
MKESRFIRLALISEKLELEQLQTRASLANERDRDALLAYPDAIQVPIEQIAGGRVFVSECQGTMAGFAAIEPREDGETELDGLFVDPRVQRRGIGKSLIEHCAAVVRQQGSRATPHAAEFYSACGFEVIGTTETRFGPGILMRKLV